MWQKRFVVDCITPYGKIDRSMTDISPQFVENVYIALFVELGRTIMTKFAYHHQTNGQTERYHKTCISQFPHNSSIHNDDWDTFVKPVTDSRNACTYPTTKKVTMQCFHNERTTNSLWNIASISRIVSAEKHPRRHVKLGRGLLVE